ncbi:MAG TPA: metalloregulator ArsR/SmtB family transcription factor [Candidatus Binatus sp.]|nr:metalloregulator ArsR/SmtB family transcription factor [Candidatus Binatus sp.]
MDQRPAEIMLQFCKAMADESRLKMIGLLSASEHSVQQLASMLELKEPTVSHHLAVLRQLDLVKMRADRNFRWYRLNDEVLGKISRAVFSRESIAKLGASADAGDSERKVLNNFVDGDRLIEIPVSYKKRLVILKWLAGFFEADISYPESQVNAVLKLHHHDCATLRREMIGCGILAREKGVYRLRPESGWRTTIK